MCLLTVFPVGQAVTQEHADWLSHGCDRNPDGFGWAVVAGDEILTGHHMSAEVALTNFRQARAEHPQGPALFHSRIATAGLVDYDNTHPFQVAGTDGSTVLAHNGILPTYLQPDKGDLRSDTRIMAEEFLPTEFNWARQRHGTEALDSPAWRRWFRKTVLVSDKVAFLTTDPRYRKRLYIVNADLGVWDRGVWWSNTSYKPWVPSLRPGYGSAGGWSDGTTWSESGTRTWVKNDRGFYEARYDEGTGEMECPMCFTVGSVGEDLVCKWCSVCTTCTRWVCDCPSDAPVRTYLDAVTDEQLESMSDAEWDAFISARMTG